MKNNNEENDKYALADTETLKKALLGGDDAACAPYIQKRIDEDALTADDVKLLEASVQNGDPSAANVGAMLFGMKGCLYEDVKKTLFCKAVLEQYDVKWAHKAVKKAYKKHTETIAEIDKTLLDKALTDAAKKLMSLKADGAIFEIEYAGRNQVNDGKSALILAMAPVIRGVAEDYDIIYVAYSRDKYIDRTLTKAIDHTAEFFKAAAKDIGLKHFTTRICDRLDYSYGDVETKEKTKIERDENEPALNVKVAESRLSSDRCPKCGAALENGVCPSCGTVVASDDDNAIVINRQKDKERLVCTQCGAPVTMDENGKTAYCPACGSTFIINGHALDDGVIGPGSNTLKTDMPSDATLPDVKFIRAKIADGKMTAILPDSFGVMSAEIRSVKYPVNPPDIILTTPDSTVNLCLTLKGALADRDVPAFGKQMFGTLKALRKDAVFGEAKLIENEHRIFYFDFMTQGLDQSIYNFMFFCAADGKQTIGSWNCLAKDRWFWAPVFEHAVKTLSFATIAD